MLKFLKKILGKESGEKTAKPPVYIPIPKTVRDIVPRQKKLTAKPVKKVPARKKVASKKAVIKNIAPALKLKKIKPIGVVTHYYAEIKVAIVKFSNPPAIGAKLRFKGATTDFAEIVKSAQFNHAPVAKIPKGKEVGIKVKSRVREGDEVTLA